MIFKKKDENMDTAQQKKSVGYFRIAGKNGQTHTKTYPSTKEGFAQAQRDGGRQKGDTLKVKMTERV